MSKFNQAELASQMRDPQTASQLLEEMAEQMRQQPSSMGSSGPNPLAEKFKSLLQELKDLIHTQDEQRNKVLTAKGGLQKIHQFRSSLPEHTTWKAYREWFKEVSKYTRQRKPIPPELLVKNGQNGHPVKEGRTLHQIYSDLSTVLAGKAPRRPWPQTTSLPDDLQEEWASLRPHLDEASEISYPKEDLLAQRRIGEHGGAFRQDFEASIAPLLPNPNLGKLARQGETYAKQAFQGMSGKKHSQSVSQDMQGASTSWKHLLSQLQSFQQAAQQAMGQRQQMLQIGQNGQLQLSSQGQPQDEGDGRFDHQDHDIEIPLPEDFQSNRSIEERLQESLRKTRNEEEMSRFKEYMLDLLE